MKQIDIMRYLFGPINELESIFLDTPKFMDDRTGEPNPSHAAVVDFLIWPRLHKLSDP